MMVLVGGYTRLSGSGLSITTWRPVHGALPPMGAQEWQEEFAAYQASPQYIKVNNGMTLEEFRAIFWPEYLHRLLGRLVGAVFLLPMLCFALRRSLSRRLAWRLTGIFALGGLQGLLGWLMVKSGLVDAPHVSHLRLASHLSMAFTIFALILWALLDVRAQLQAPSRLTQVKVHTLRLCVLWFCLLGFQIIIGAFMAGLHAGLIYNTWPTMDGQWIPDGLMAVSPWHDNIPLVQFIHRKLAIFLAVSFFFVWMQTRKYATDNQLKIAFGAVAAVLVFQVGLGIATLLCQAPLALALAHQMAGLLLFAASVLLLHAVKLRTQAVNVISPEQGPEHGIV